MKDEIIQKNKKALQELVVELERSLETVAHQIGAGDDWVADIPAHNQGDEDITVQADDVAVMETNISVLNKLEPRLLEVKEALLRIDNGTYGVCEKCNKEIEEDRLSAMPTAKECIACLG